MSSGLKVSAPVRGRAAISVLLLAIGATALGTWFVWQRAVDGLPSPGRGEDARAPATAASGGGPVAAAPAPLSASQVERGLERARASVQSDPSDASAWAMLAHTSEMAGRFDEAVKAYAKLVALRPNDAQAHADYADALGVVQGGVLQGTPARLLQTALRLDPGNLKALVLGAKEAFARKDYAASMALWERARAATQDPSLQRTIETSLAEARALLTPTTAGAASAPFVSGRVTVGESLKARVGADDTVFVFARPADGSRMPVALLRKKGSDLPLDFALDDTLALVPQARLSQHDKVIVGARISRRGDAIPASGDLESEVGPVKLGSVGLKIEIDRARP